MTVGQWTVLFAAVGAIAATAAGERDMRLDKLNRSTHAIAHVHRVVGFSLLANLILLAAARWVLGHPGPVYLIYGWIVLALVIVQAWLGGELVYAHGAGVAPAGQGQQAAGDAQRLSLNLYRRLLRSDPAASGADAHHP